MATTTILGKEITALSASYALTASYALSSAGGGVTSVSASGIVSGLTLGGGPITSTGTVTLSGTLAVTPSNFSSQTANHILAAPNGTAGVPTFRAMVATDVPTLNQNTTGNASTATLVTGTSGQLQTKDDRIIEPNSITAGRLQFGFTSWNNNNSSPYADYLHLRSYTDGTGGSDNLVMIRKDAIGMRIWQQTYESATAYSSYKDVAWTDGTNASGTWTINVTGSLFGTSSWARNATTASQVQTVGTATNASHYLTFVDSVNGTPAADLLYTDTNINLNPSTNRLEITGSLGVTGSLSVTGSLGVTGVIRGEYPTDPGAGGAAIAKLLSYTPSPYGLVFRGYASGLHSIQVQREATDAEIFGLSLQPNGGNVGIGTTTPNAKLDVSGSFSQGLLSLASGLFAHAQGYQTTASGDYSHAEGSDTKAIFGGAHAEGYTTYASGAYSHAEGAFTSASGDYSHAEGNGSSTVGGTYSHAEGYFTLASGLASHAEGRFTQASAQSSHAEGRFTTASADYSHTEGFNTVASGDYQHVQGQYNISSSAQSAFILGNGTGLGALRSNLIFASGSLVQITGSLIATAGFTGSFQGTASLATTATTATSASTQLVTTNALYYPVFVDANNASPTSEKLGTVGNLTYNPSIGSLNATSITGSFQGTASLATTATSASTHTITTNALHYPVFVDANNASPTTEKLGTVGGYNFNPSTNRLAITGSLGVTAGITGSLQGTASYATMASQSGYTMQFVLATTGSNPATNTTYYMGAPVATRLVTATGTTRVYVPRPGRVRTVYIYVRTNGTLASAGTSTFIIQKNSSIVVEAINTSTTACTTANAAISSSAVSMSVVQGDFLEIQFGTPAWGTAPTGVEANAIIYIENNL